MRKTIRHVAVLAAAVAMFTAIAVPAQSRGFPTETKLDLLEVTCYEDVHYVTAVAADKSGKEQQLFLSLGIPAPEGGYLPIDSDSAGGTGLLEVQVAGFVGGEYFVDVYLTTFRKPGVFWRYYQDQVHGWC